MPAPPGNTNALKHGFYAKRIKPDQSKILEKAGPLSVEHEIAVLRAIFDNILGEIEATNKVDDPGKDSAREIREYVIPDFSYWQAFTSRMRVF